MPVARDKVGREYRGIGAKEAILRRLADWPKARALAADIADFYGNCLQYLEDGALTSSRYTIELAQEPLALNYARIELQLGTRRTAEALVHELLHLHTGMRGYVLGAAVFIPPELARHAHHFLGMHPKIMNLLEHELIIDRFLSLGFDRTNFLGCLCPAPDYQDVASKASPSFGYCEEIGFPWWCLEYLRHWISVNHGGKGCDSNAESALYWGSTVHPEIKEAAKRIRALIASGAIRDQKHYHYRVNALLHLIRIPGFTQWVTLQPQDGQRSVLTPVGRPSHGHSPRLLPACAEIGA